MTKQNKTKSLYTIKDVKEVREQLLDEQLNHCKLSLHPIEKGKAVLDHDHKTQKVRAVLHRQTNAALGKIENLWTRYLAYWYPNDLPSFLRQCAQYLENNEEDRWYHPKWLARVKTDFNKLNAKQQTRLLEILGTEEGSNAAARKSLFNSCLLSKQFDYDNIMYAFTKVQEVS